MKKRGSRNSRTQIIDGPAKNLQFLLKTPRIKTVVIGKEKKKVKMSCGCEGATRKKIG